MSVTVTYQVGDGQTETITREEIQWGENCVQVFDNPDDEPGLFNRRQIPIAHVIHADHHDE